MSWLCRIFGHIFTRVQRYTHMENGKLTKKKVEFPLMHCERCNATNTTLMERHKDDRRPIS